MRSPLAAALKLRDELERRADGASTDWHLAFDLARPVDELDPGETHHLGTLSIDCADLHFALKKRSTYVFIEWVRPEGDEWTKLDREADVEAYLDEQGLGPLSAPIETQVLSDFATHLFYGGPVYETKKASENMIPRSAGFEATKILEIAGDPDSYARAQSGWARLRARYLVWLSRRVYGAYDLNFALFTALFLGYMGAMALIDPVALIYGMGLLMAPGAIAAAEMFAVREKYGSLRRRPSRLTFGLNQMAGSTLDRSL